MSDQWDNLFRILAAEPRRALLFALCEAPEDTWVRLPEAAHSRQYRGTEAHLTIALQHNHLPQLVSMDYIDWKEDPFVATHGPRFKEISVILGAIDQIQDQLPSRLIDTYEWGCGNSILEHNKKEF